MFDICLIDPIDGGIEDSVFQHWVLGLELEETYDLRMKGKWVEFVNIFFWMFCVVFVFLF